MNEADACPLRVRAHIRVNDVRHLGPVCALQQPRTAMQRQRPELRQRVILGGAFGRRRHFDRHERLPDVLVDFVAVFGQSALSHVRPVVIDYGFGIGPGEILDLGDILIAKPQS